MLPPQTADIQAIGELVLGSGFDPSAVNTLYRAYFRYYNSIFSPSPNKSIVAAEIDSPALTTHEDVLRSIQLVTANPTWTRDHFTNEAFKDSASSSDERQYAVKQIIAAAFMINCSSKDYYSKGFQHRLPTKARWEGAQTFTDFLQQAFNAERVASRQKYPIFRKSSLKAWKLVKRNKIKIRPTDNLLEHLHYDPDGRVLSVFHQTVYLQTQLKISKSLDLDAGFQESINLGHLPPRLLLETLITIHIILFPLVDIGSNRKSTKLLRKLIKKHNFDPEATWVDFIRPIPDDFPLTYWGSRLSILADIVGRPPPTNALVRWFERHTSERNALTAAILGLFLAALFGLLGVIIGVLQLFVAWKTWIEGQVGPASQPAAF